MTDELPFTRPDWDSSRPEREPRKCSRHQWREVHRLIDTGHGPTMRGDEWITECRRCGVVRDETRARRGRNNRSRGNRAELAVARTYGGEKTGPLGQAEDVRGKDWRTQLKTHQGLPPARWRKIFAALDTQADDRLPRIIERYLPGQGIKPEDYIVVRGADWLDWFGRDE